MRVSACAVLLAILGLVTPGLAAGVSPAALELWREALDYHRAKDAGRALDTFLKAYHADPAVLGLDSEGLLDRSIDHLRETLGVKKDDLVFTFKLAEMLNLKGNLPEAIATYKKVVAINPNSPMAQRAADEARKLEGFQLAMAPPPVAAPASPATTSTAVSPATTSALPPGPAASPSADPDAPAVPSPEEARIKELTDQLAASKEETMKVQKDLDDLKLEHEKTKDELKKATTYKNLFFANPKNVENLQKGIIK